MKYLLIGVGGGAGSIARYLAANAIVTRWNSRFPWGTLVVNVTGCFLIGILMTIFSKRFPFDTQWRPLLVIGFLGGYTTFSSFEWETYASVRAGFGWMGLLNVAASVMLGYGAVWLGSLLVER